MGTSRNLERYPHDHSQISSQEPLSLSPVRRQDLPSQFYPPPPPEVRSLYRTLCWLGRDSTQPSSQPYRSTQRHRPRIGQLLPSPPELRLQGHSNRATDADPLFQSRIH